MGNLRQFYPFRCRRVSVKSSDNYFWLGKLLWSGMKGEMIWSNYVIIPYHTVNKPKWLIEAILLKLEHPLLRVRAEYSYLVTITTYYFINITCYHQVFNIQASKLKSHNKWWLMILVSVINHHQQVLTVIKSVDCHQWWRMMMIDEDWWQLMTINDYNWVLIMHRQTTKSL